MNRPNDIDDLIAKLEILITKRQFIFNYNNKIHTFTLTEFNKLMEYIRKLEKGF